MKTYQSRWRAVKIRQAIISKSNTHLVERSTLQRLLKDQEVERMKLIYRQIREEKIESSKSSIMSILRL